jgi:hypothetical protein
MVVITARVSKEMIRCEVNLNFTGMGHTVEIAPLLGRVRVVKPGSKHFQADSHTGKELAQSA